MRVRRTLFALWCWVVNFVWVAITLGGEGDPVFRKVRDVGWSAAYKDLSFIALIAVVLPLIVLAAGWGLFHAIDRFRAKAN